MTKILIADDNRDFVELLESVLTGEDYSVDVVYDGQSAIEILKTDVKYDLLITDIIMPGSDGFDVIDFVKSNTKTKIIAVSGGGVFLSSESAVKAIDEKVDASLQKPVKIDDLLVCVSKVLAE